MVWHALARLVFPARCPGCGVPAEPVCDACARTLRAPPSLPIPPGVDAWVSPLAYEGVARELVARVKYRHGRAALPWLGGLLARAVRDRYPPGSFDAVTWPPTTTARRRERGFDHAELLAGQVARALSLPRLRALRRGPGPAQTGLPSEARRRGPAFDARREVPRRLLLVDDVGTTGATVRSAAGTLRRAGAAVVVVATAARTPPGRARGDDSRDPARVPTMPVRAGTEPKEHCGAGPPNVEAPRDPQRGAPGPSPDDGP